MNGLHRVATLVGELYPRAFGCEVDKPIDAFLPDERGGENVVVKDATLARLLTNLDADLNYLGGVYCQRLKEGEL